ncbi:hypothetical protein Tco_0762294 [Tanacetum coccineum]
MPRSLLETSYLQSYEQYIVLQSLECHVSPPEWCHVLFSQDCSKNSRKPLHLAGLNGLELSEVALAKKAQLKEVRKKSLRDFHKIHPSGSGTVAEKPPSVEKITPTITSEGTSDKLGVLDVTEDDSTKSEYESWGNDEDDNNNRQEASDESSEQENESKERKTKRTHSDKEAVQGEGADAEMIDAQQGNENLETTQE